MTTLTAQRPIPPTRLVVIQPEGIAVYEGRKVVAFSREQFEYSARDIEEMRIDDYTKA